jgi:hypothetical protein
MGRARGDGEIPDAEAWRGDQADSHLRRAREILFGKSIDEARPCFGGGASIGLAQALRHMTRGALRSYVRAFEPAVYGSFRERADAVAALWQEKARR